MHQGGTKGYRLSGERVSTLALFAYHEFHEPIKPPAKEDATESASWPEHPPKALGCWEFWLCAVENQSLKLPTKVCWEVLGGWPKLPTPPNILPQGFVGVHLIDYTYLTHKLPTSPRMGSICSSNVTYAPRHTLIRFSSIGLSLPDLDSLTCLPLGYLTHEEESSGG